jgi:hypothetical protein
MESIIDNKMYELITKSENFDFAWDINERFVTVKERLVEDFWNEIVLYFKRNLEDFKFINEERHYIELKSKLHIKLEFILQIHENQIVYGLTTKHNGTKKKKSEIESLFSDEFEDYTECDEGKSFYFYETEDENLTTLDGLKKILPEKRDKLIEMYFQDFKEMLTS